MRSLCVLLLCAAACTYPTSEPAYSGPSPEPLTITVTTLPPAAADGVPRDAQIRATLDDYPDPDRVFFGPVVLKSGKGNFDSDLRLDFVGKAILVQPRTLLTANTTYELVIGPTIASLSGRTTGSQQTFRIDVGGTVAGPQPARARVAWNPSPGVIGVKSLIQTCANYCHSDHGCRLPRRPTRQLYTTGPPDDPVFGMINVPAVGMRGLPQPLLRVAPFDPARSELLRKLIGGNAVHDSRDPPYPDVRVDGRRMPLAEPICDDPEPPPFDDVALRQIQDWIDGGALLD